MEKYTIKNREGLNIVIEVEQKQNQKGLVFVMHGLSGNKEQNHIVTIAQAFKDSYYTVVKFDTTNTFGESDGSFEDATTTNFYQDLEDVIKWSKSQGWYQEPFVLAGHSLGSICSLLYAEKYPEKIKAVAPLSTVSSGKLSFETYAKEELEKWQRDGYLITKSKTRPGLVKKLKWSHMEDRLKYNLLPEVNKLIMPIILIVGDKDTLTPLKHHKLLYDNLPGKKELHIIRGAGHNFREDKHLVEIKEILTKCIKAI
jgi:pimeloyl-ACP methyl ester carboxylesterase